MKDNRGGARPGAGRPRKKQEWSERTKGELVKALRKKAKETGKDTWDVMADLIHSGRTPAHVRAHLLRLVADILVTRETRTEEHRYEHSGPGVLLPPVMPKPREAIEREKEFTPGMN